MTAVNRQCQPVGPEDFESFSLAFLVGAGLEVETLVTFDLGLAALPEELGFPSSYEYSFWAPHSMSSIVRLMGGAEGFVTRL